MRRSKLVMGALALIVIGLTVLVGLGLTKTVIRTDLDTFLPKNDPVAQEYERLAQTFGADPIAVLITAPEGTSLLEGDALKQTVSLEGQLSRLDDVHTVYGPGTLLNQIAGRAQDLLLELFGRRDAEIAKSGEIAKRQGKSVKAAEARVRATFDSRYGPLLVRGLPAGLPTLGNSKFIDNVVFESDGDSRGQWQLLVPNRQQLTILVRPAQGLNTDQVADLVAEVRKTVGGAELGEVKVASASASVAALSDRSASDAPLLGGLALVAISLCFMVATWIRRKRRLLPVATTLVAIVCTVSLFGWLGKPLTVAVMAFLSVLLGIGCYYPTYLAMKAPTRTFVTVIVASALSLGTLALSPLPLVQDLGLVMGAGVLFSGVVAFACRGWLRNSTDEGPDGATEQPGVGTRWRPAAMGLLAVLCLTSVLGWVQLDNLEIKTDVDDFAAGLPALQEAREVEKVLGSSGEMSVVVGGSDVLRPESVAYMRKTWTNIVNDYGDQAKALVSPPALMNFLGSDPTAKQIDAAYRLLPSYLTETVISKDRSMAVLVFGVSIDDLDKLTSTVEGVKEIRPPEPDGIESKVSGLPLVFVKAEQLVSEDRFRANILGIGAAGLVLLLGLRRRWDAVRGIVAATLATGSGFALVALFNGALNPITAALGALTAALGCEFTVLLAESARGRTHLRKAVFLVAATSCAGYLVLLASGLDVVRSFGVFLAAGVALALVSSWSVVAATVRPDSDRDQQVAGGESPQPQMTGALL